MQKKFGIGALGLTLLITGSIDSIRNMPMAALFGTQLPFFFLLATLVFLLPIGLIAADLSSRKSADAGIYGWSKHAFGKPVAMSAVWLQWINTLVWYPTILSFIAGTSAYIIAPALAHNKWYICCTMVSLFWLFTWINLKGLQTSTRFASLLTSIGMLLPVLMLIGFGIFWALKGMPSQLHFSSHNLLPRWGNAESWVSLTAIITSFLGLELACVHVNNVRNAQRKFPQALLSAMCLIFITMICGAMAIAYVIPGSQMRLVDGVMQSFSVFFHQYHLMWLLPIMPLLIILGNLGSIINWMISPTKGIMLIAQDGLLPPALARTNSQDVPHVVMIFQACLVTLLCAIYLFVPNLNSIYWLLTDLSTELYLFMYIIMLLSAWKLKAQNSPQGFTIPGGRISYYSIIIIGIVGVVTGLVVGFIPPSNTSFVASQHYAWLFAFCLLICLTPCYILYSKYKKQDNKDES